MLLWTTISLLGVIPFAYPAPIPEASTVPQLSVTDQAPIVGFDCNQTEPEILTISSLEVGKCPEPSSLKPVVRAEYGQILQKVSFDMVHIRTCQLTKSTSYFRCARNWYNYNVYPASIGVIKSVSTRDCDKLHDQGIFNYDPHRAPWVDLEINKTYHFAVNEVGWTDQYGYCEGGTYYLENREHKDLVVQASYTISVRESWGKVDIDSSALNIENALQCDYKKGNCADAKTGTHVWTPKEKVCGKDGYTELYKGPVNITTSTGDSTVILSVNHAPFLFTTELGLGAYTCGLNMKLTEFPGVFFLPQSQGNYQGSFPPTGNANIEFITYLNSKVTFMYHNLIDSARDMFLTAIQRTCEVEREMLKNRIEIIRLNSQSGGLSTLLKEGMFARANGEVIHMIKCEPTPVQLRPSSTCHEDLPVLHKGSPMYLRPHTHILSPFSPEIPCTPITPVTYKIGGKWWSFNGQYQLSNNPEMLQPHQQADLPFTRIKSFSKGGMYPAEQIEAVQKMIMFPTLREAIATDLASGVTNYYGKVVNMDLTSIMSDHDYENIAKKNLKKVWGYFSNLGNAVSGLIGFYFCYRLIKGILTCFIDGKDLYAVFGCSFRLLAMFWTRLSLYFIHQATFTRDAASGRTPPQDSDGSQSREEADGGDEGETEDIQLQPYRRVFHPSAPLSPMECV